MIMPGELAATFVQNTAACAGAGVPNLVLYNTAGCA
jgi:hypothetical protein